MDKESEPIIQSVPYGGNYNSGDKLEKKFLELKNLREKYLISEDEHLKLKQKTLGLT